MALHLRLLLALGALTLGSGAAFADSSDKSKGLEAAPGSASPVRAGKMKALFSTQMQLFIEQKEAPAASKTSLLDTSTPRLSQKSKD